MPLLPLPLPGGGASGITRMPPRRHSSQPPLVPAGSNLSTSGAAGAALSHRRAPYWYSSAGSSCSLGQLRRVLPAAAETVASAPPAGKDEPLRPGIPLAHALPWRQHLRESSPHSPPRDRQAAHGSVAESGRLTDSSTLTSDCGDAGCAAVSKSAMRCRSITLGGGMCYRPRGRRGSSCLGGAQAAQSGAPRAAAANPAGPAAGAAAGQIAFS